MSLTGQGTDSFAPHPFPIKAGAKSKLMRRNNHGSGISGSAGGTFPEMPQQHYPNNYTVDLPPSYVKQGTMFSKSNTLKKVLISKRTSNRTPMGAAASDKLHDDPASFSPKRDSHSVGYNIGAAV